MLDRNALTRLDIAHGHLGVRVLSLKELRGLDGEALAVAVGPRRAADGDLEAREGVRFDVLAPPDGSKLETELTVGAGRRGAELLLCAPLESPARS
jgi:hypothetical protein